MEVKKLKAHTVDTLLSRLTDLNTNVSSAVLGRSDGGGQCSKLICHAASEYTGSLTPHSAMSGGRPFTSIQAVEGLTSTHGEMQDWLSLEQSLEEYLALLQARADCEKQVLWKSFHADKHMPATQILVYANMVVLNCTAGTRSDRRQGNNPGKQVCVSKLHLMCH